MSSTGRYYAVANGREGPRMIYSTWKEAELNVKGMKGCKQKLFHSAAEAEAYLDENPPPPPPEGEKRDEGAAGSSSSSSSPTRTPTTTTMGLGRARTLSS
jgi:viroplasmin and RNaseH domain-containing protein